MVNNTSPFGAGKVSAKAGIDANEITAAVAHKAFKKDMSAPDFVAI
jgi:hypothetical protein